MHLSFRNVSIRHGQHCLFHNITLNDIKAGSLVAVLGPNGVGKSSWVKAMAGINRYQGSVKLDDLELNKMSQAQRLKHIGYVPQTLPQGSNLLAYEVVLSTASSVARCHENVTISTQVENTFAELGIEHLAMKTMHQLSGGQKQMVSLAQSLIRQPDLYLLDEPTSALDLNWQIQILEAIKKQVEQKKSIALLISHDINLALRHCDQIILLANGQVLGQGATEQTLNVDNLKEAFKVQTRIEKCSLGYPVVLVDKSL